MPEPRLPGQAPIQGMRPYAQILGWGLNKEEQGKEPVPTTNDTEEKDNTFPTPTGALMIFGGSTAYDSRRRQKVARCEEGW